MPNLSKAKSGFRNESISILYNNVHQTSLTIHNESKYRNNAKHKRKTQFRTISFIINILT